MLRGRSGLLVGYSIKRRAFTNPEKGLLQRSEKGPWLKAGFGR